jgi:O-antigen/teichoic acid export membrane protein
MFAASTLLRIRGQFAGRVIVLAVATAIQATLAVVQILLATRILSADDFGLYAMIISGVVLAGAMCEGGASMVFPVHHAEATPAERASLFTSVAGFATVIGTCLGLLLIISWPWRHLVLGQSELVSLPYGIVVIVALLTPLRAVVQQTVTVFSVSGRGIAIAIQMTVQSVCGIVVTLGSLFLFDAGVAALFLGTLAANLAGLVIGLWMLGVDHLTATPSRRWIGLIIRTAPTATARGLVDAAWNFCANTMLGQVRGLNAVGIFGQARLYNSFLLSFGNSIAHNAWVVSLAEARAGHSQFAATRRMWAPVHVAIVAFGLIFAFIGQEIVDLLSNGKLTPAAIYVPIFAAITLVQNSGKAATAVVFASGCAPAATRLRTVFVLLSLLALYPMISVFGVAGILGLLFAEALAYRISLQILAAATGRLPWQDDIVVTGVVALLAASFYVHHYEPSFSLRVGILAIILAAIASLGHRMLVDAMIAGLDLFRTHAGRSSVGPDPKSVILERTRKHERTID